MRSLLDINVVIALLDSRHDFHDRAQAWWAEHSLLEWATCPIIQNGVIRIMSSSTYYPKKPFSAKVVADLLYDLVVMQDHEFWGDDVSLLDHLTFDIDVLIGNKQLTDIYLLGLAAKNGGRLVTFDTRVTINPVLTANPSNLLHL